MIVQHGLTGRHTIPFRDHRAQLHPRIIRPDQPDTIWQLDRPDLLPGRTLIGQSDTFDTGQFGILR